MRKYPKQTTQNLDDLDIEIEIPEELDAEAMARLIRRWALRPLDWAHYFFPSHFRIPSPPFHQDIIDTINYSSETLTGFEAPRGFAKTTLAEFLSFHCAIFERVPFIIFISKTEEIASGRLTTIIHEMEHNKLFKLFFGDLKTEKWGEKEFVMRSEKLGVHCKFLARGLGQQVLGLKYLQHRPWRIFVDDPEDMQIAENPKNTDKNERWLTKEVIPALDKHHGKTILISTPVTAGCLIERVFGYKHAKTKRYSAITEKGLPLWREHMSIRQLMELKEQLAAEGQLSVWFTEYLCNPLPPERHPFDERGVEYYDTKEIYDKEKKKYIPMNIFQLGDLAVGEKKRNNYSALVTIGVDAQDTWWVLDIFQVKEDWEAFAKDMYVQRDKWKPLDVGVERAAVQQGFWSVLELVAQKYEYKPIYATPLTPDKDKDSRVLRLLPRFKHKKIKFQRNQRPLIEQLILFPDSKDRDLLDCLAYGEIFCYPIGTTAPTEEKIESWRGMKAATDKEIREEYDEEVDKDEDELDLD